MRTFFCESRLPSGVSTDASRCGLPARFRSRLRDLVLRHRPRRSCGSLDRDRLFALSIADKNAYRRQPSRVRPGGALRGRRVCAKIMKQFGPSVGCDSTIATASRPLDRMPLHYADEATAEQTCITPRRSTCASSFHFTPPLAFRCYRSRQRRTGVIAGQIARHGTAVAELSDAGFLATRFDTLQAGNASASDRHDSSDACTGTDTQTKCLLW